MYASLNPLIFARAGAVFSLAPECSLQHSDFTQGGLIITPTSQPSQQLPMAYGVVKSAASYVTVDVTLHLNGAGDKALVWWLRMNVNSILGDANFSTDRAVFQLMPVMDLSIKSMPSFQVQPVSGSNADFQVTLEGWMPVNDAILAAITL